MTKSDKLTKIIERAEKRGYKLNRLGSGDGELPAMVEGAINIRLHYYILLSHDFAKAYWGEESIDCSCSHDCKCKCWVCNNGWEQFPLEEVHSWHIHLQQCVLSKDPIGYYWKNKPE